MVDLGRDVTGNGISKLVFTILSAISQKERDRVRDAERHRASQRLYNGDPSVSAGRHLEHLTNYILSCARPKVARVVEASNLVERHQRILKVSMRRRPQGGYFWSAPRFHLLLRWFAVILRAWIPVQSVKWGQFQVRTSKRRTTRTRKRSHGQTGTPSSPAVSGRPQIRFAFCTA